MPDHLPKATESVPQIVAFIEELIDGGHAYAVAGRRLLPRRVASPSTGGSRASGPTRSRSRSRTRSRRTAATSRSGRRTSPRPRTRGGTRRGAAAGPGWHIECSAMAEEIYGPAFEIHGGGLDLVFPHHENEVAQSRALGHPFAAIWAHNGMLRFTGEKMSKSLGNVDDDPRGARRVGPRGAARLLPDRVAGASRSTSRRRRWRRRPRGATRCGTRSRVPAAEHDESGWAAFAAALDDDFDTPAALAVLHDWASTGSSSCCGAASASSGSSRSPSATEAPPEVVELAERRAEARAARDFETSDRLRDELAALGLGDARPSRRLRPRARVTPDLVYGRRAVREALRGRREVLEVWATERARQGRGLARRGAAEAEGRARALRAGRDARPPGRARARRAVPLRRRLRAGGGREAAARRARPRHRPAQPRRRRAAAPRARARPASSCPAHGSAVVTPAVARASAGAVEHLPIAVVTNLARYLEEVKGADLWVYGAAGDAERARRCGRPISRAASRSCSAPRATGLRPLVRRTCDALVSIPLAGEVESLNVSVAAAVLAVRGASASVADADALPLRRLQPAARRAVRRRARARRRARELRRDARRARRRRLRRRRRGRRARAARRCASRRTPTRCSSGSRPSTGRASGCCS